MERHLRKQVEASIEFASPSVYRAGLREAHLPGEPTTYALRGLNAVHRRAATYGDHIAACAAALLKHSLSWSKVRQVYRLLGLVRRHDAELVDEGPAAAPWRPRRSMSA
jgi:hypothetical protein